MWVTNEIYHDWREPASARRESSVMPCVLVVEDDETVGALLRILLTRAGYNVSLAGTGPAAIARFDYDDPDLVLLDVSLPGLDGFGVLDHLRKTGSNTPVIMLTAERDTEQRALDAGADVHMRKPFENVALVSAISRLIAVRSAQ